jgi:hypothetical protein
LKLLKKFIFRRDKLNMRKSIKDYITSPNQVSNYIVNI